MGLIHLFVFCLEGIYHLHPALAGRFWWSKGNQPEEFPQERRDERVLLPAWSLCGERLWAGCPLQLQGFCCLQLGQMLIHSAQPRDRENIGYRLLLVQTNLHIKAERT